MSADRQNLIGWIAGGIVIVVVVIGTVIVIRSNLRNARAERLGQELDAGRAALESGRIDTARSILNAIVAEESNYTEAWFLLGQSEAESGRLEEAEMALRRVPETDDEFYPTAALYLARIALLEGVLSDAEAILTPTLLQREGDHLPQAFRDRASLLRLQGRPVEAKLLYREAIERFDQDARLLRTLWDVDNALANNQVRTTLETGFQNAPDDDRVWLGLAHHDRLEGKFDEAKEWLDRCQQRRPDDPAIWRERLALAQETDDPQTAHNAIQHLSGDLMTTAELLELKAWFARSIYDSETERQALLDALEAGSRNRSTLYDRLAILAIESGHMEEAEHYRTLKAPCDAAHTRYFEIIYGPIPSAYADELAKLAVTLGWNFEATQWAKMALLDLEDLGVSQSGSSIRFSLADLRDELTGFVDRPSSSTFTSRQGELIRPTFVDRAIEVGLNFSYDPHRLDPKRSIVEMMGGGLALFDFDNDGWLDLFVVQGGRFPPLPGQLSGDRLFRNLGDGTFEDVTAVAGIDQMPGGYSFGVIAGDGDGDGYTDLLVTRWKSCLWLRNRGDGTFEDATSSVGLDQGLDWPTSAALADLDLDGDLDLYICQYLVARPEHPADGDSTVPMPLKFPSLVDRLYRNDGGRFTDVTESSGIAEVDAEGRGLGVLSTDLNDDGALDLYVANDMTANFLFLNRGDWQFEDFGEVAGVASDSQGGYQAGMGVTCGDLDADGLPDLVVTNYIVEGMTFYRNLGSGLYTDQTEAVGLRASTRHLLGFGTAFLDANNDGRLDLAATNGHVTDIRPRDPFHMPGLLMLGTESGRMIDASETSGEGWTVPRVGRGLVVGDLDNDGRVDVLVVSHDTPLAYLHNETEPASNFLTLELEATATASAADGARVTVETGERRLVGWKVSGGSYQSASDPRLHFGLGDADQVELIKVRWPSGSLDHYEQLPANTGWKLQEGDPTPTPLPGFVDTRISSDP